MAVAHLTQAFNSPNTFLLYGLVYTRFPTVSEFESAYLPTPSSLHPPFTRAACRQKGYCSFRAYEKGVSVQSRSPLIRFACMAKSGGKFVDFSFLLLAIRGSHRLMAVHSTQADIVFAFITVAVYREPKHVFIRTAHPITIHIHTCPHSIAEHTQVTGR